MKKFSERQSVESQTRYRKRDPHLTNCSKIKLQDKKNRKKNYLWRNENWADSTTRRKISRREHDL